MEEINKQFFNDIDPTLLAVKGKFNNGEEASAYIKKLTNAICKVVEKHNEASLRCIGTNSIANAIRASTIARNDLLITGISLLMTTDFSVVDFGNGEKVDAVLIKVFCKE